MAQLLAPYEYVYRLRSSAGSSWHCESKVIVFISSGSLYSAWGDKTHSIIDSFEVFLSLFVLELYLFLY